MAFSKTLLLLGLAFLVVSSIVSARELAETTQENLQVDFNHFGEGLVGYDHGGGYGKGHGKEHRKGKGGKGHGGHRKPGHGGRPPSETEEGN